MTDGRLDLSGRSDLGAYKALVARLSECLAVNAQNVVLASSPQDGYRAIEEVGLKLADDRCDLGLIGLDTAVETDVLSLVQLGSSGAPISAIVASVEDAARIAERLSPPPAVLLDVGLQALRPAARVQARLDRERRDEILTPVLSQLLALEGVAGGAVGAGGVMLDGAAPVLKEVLRQLGLEGGAFDGGYLLRVASAKQATTLSDWLGTSRSTRSASVRRTTKETDIALSVDLDGQGVSAKTGLHFFDHMLDQVGKHGGFRLDVLCEGDVEVDAHHTIEDVCLALGEGLREALGDKRGIARFGFETPMDETRASVWIDLSGRPYCRFEGDIPGERVGDFPIEMCEHAFRSIAETLKAAIHVKVDGENAHHMVESCFKSFGRALRMAKTIESDALPSTKGVL